MTVLLEGFLPSSLVINDALMRHPKSSKSVFSFTSVLIYMHRCVLFLAQ